MLKLVLLLVFIFALAILSPIGGIWSLNTLFGLGIPYTFQTWAAALFLIGVFSNGATKAALDK